MQVLIKIDEARFKDIQRIAEVQLDRRTDTVEQLIANGTPIPENATNGDMIKAMFPNIEVKTGGVITSVKGLDCYKGALLPYRQFWSEWWNSPYQKGGKE